MKSVVTCVVLAAAFFVGVFVSTSARLSEPVAGALQLRAINQAIALEDKAKASQAPDEKVKLQAAADFAKESANEAAGPSPLQKLSELVHAFIGFVTALGAWFMRIAGRFYTWLRNEVGMFSGEDEDDSDDLEDEEDEEEDINSRLDKLEALIRQVATVQPAAQVPGWSFPTPAPSVAPKPPATL